MSQTVHVIIIIIIMMYFCSTTFCSTRLSTCLWYVVIKLNEQKYSWIVMIDASAMFKLVQVGKGLKYVLDSDTIASSGKCAHQTLFNKIRYICRILAFCFYCADRTESTLVSSGVTNVLCK